jgi:hypothetical protein
LLWSSTRASRMTRQTRRAIRTDRLSVLLHQPHGIVRVTANAPHRAWGGRKRTVAVIACRRPVDPERDREADIMLWRGDGHRPQGRACGKRERNNRGHPSQ